MSDLGRGIVGAFRSENAAVTLHCNSLDDFSFAISNLNQVCTGHPQLVTNPTAHQLLTRTCLQHELRHYHDFLVSFCGFEILRRKVQLAANAYHYFRYFDWSAVDYFPFPLHDWALAPQTSRKEFRAWLERYYGLNLERVYDPGTVAIEDLKSTVMSDYEADESTGSLRVLLRDAATVLGLHNDRVPERHGDLSAQDVYEIGGIARQMLGLFDLVGVDSAIELTRATLRDGYYGRCLNMFATLLRGMGVRDILRFQMSIATYCIAAEPPIGTEPLFFEPSPCYRLLRLVSHLEGKGSEVRRRMGDLEILVDYFASLLNEPPMLERIEASNDWFGKRCDEMASIVSAIASHRNAQLDQELLRFLSVCLELRKRFFVALSDSQAAWLEGEFEGRRAPAIDMPPVILDMSKALPLPEAERLDVPLFQPGRSVAIYWSDYVNSQRASFEAYAALEALTSYVFFGDDPMKSPELADSRDDALKKLIPARMIRYIG